MRGQGAHPRWGVRSTLPIFFFFKFLLNLEGKNIKLIISQKLRIAQKKSYVQKMSVWSIPIFHENLANFEGNWFFGCPKHPFWTPVAAKHDMMWCAIIKYRRLMNPVNIRYLKWYSYSLSIYFFMYTLIYIYIYNHEIII